jgi:NAD dependent epimerase/dehydratase family enzyme
MRRERLRGERLRGAGRLGNGRQVLAWIHFADEVGAIRPPIEHPTASARPT